MLAEIRTKKTAVTKYGRNVRSIVLPFESHSILQGGSERYLGEIRRRDTHSAGSRQALKTAGETPALREVAGDGASATRSHALVIRAAPALGRNPGNDLVGIGDVAGLAVNAISRVQADALAMRLRRVFNEFINVGRAEVLARTAVLFCAALVADVGVGDHQVRGLIFFVLGAGVVEVGELVESKLAVALRRAKQMGFGAAVGGKFCELFHVLVAEMRGVAVAKGAAAGELLQARVEHAREKSLFKSLMKVAHLPQFFFDPAGVDFLLELAERRGGGVVFHQRIEGRLGGEHAALDGEVNALEAL